MAISTKQLKEKANEVAKKAGTSAKKAAEKTGSYISENPKTAIYVVIGALAIYTGYKLYKSVNNATDSFLDPNIDNSVDGTGGSTTGSTITNAQAANYAQQLLDAMNQNDFWLGYGTDEETILSVFKKISSADFIKIYNAFGNKDYNGYNSPPDNWLAYLDSYQPRNLVYWLKSELSSSDGEVYTLVKQIVEAAGFAF